jgi:hypothetical protein
MQVLLSKIKMRWLANPKQEIDLTGARENLLCGYGSFTRFSQVGIRGQKACQ